LRKIWLVKKADKARLDRLVKELNISPIIAHLLINRSISDPGEAYNFLDCSLASLHDPFMMKGMRKAVDRIKRAVSKGERILVYGDYDVDGITSVALLVSVLTRLGGNASEYIPNRLEEGYGLNLDACQLAHRKKINLLISVDCGINAKREVDFLNSRGIDVIVVDHHELQADSLPNAHAIINPLQDGCGYPFKHLAGVGLAFKLAQSILGSSIEEAKDLLDLVALGTVADVVPQVGENRVLTRHGLDVITNTKRIGLKELIKVSGLTGKDISSGHVGYILGPRINASGRIGSPKKASRLLLTDNIDEAKELAQVLDCENKNRRAIESKILKEAVEKVKVEVNFKEHKVIVISAENWHPGVIGIVASRLVDKFYRPTAVISAGKSMGRGSARSISDFNLFEAISKCKSYLSEFGGHEAACGFSIDKKDIVKFKESFNKVATETLKPEHLLPKLKADMDIPLNMLSEELICQIARLAPHGPKNPSPVFVSRQIRLKKPPRLIGRKGVKFWVTDGKITCEAIAFGVSDIFLDTLKNEGIDLAYSPTMNAYRGLRSIQLNLEDLKASEDAL